MEISIREAAPFCIISLAGDVDLHSSPQARQAILDANGTGGFDAITFAIAS